VRGVLTVRRPGSPLVAAALVVLAAGCHDVPIFGSTPHEPAVYVVLMREIAVNELEGTLGDSSLFGLVANLGSAYDIQYRPVEQLSLTRRADGAEFDWTYLPRTGGFDNLLSSGVDLVAEGNLRLPWNGTAGRLGRDSIAGGEIVDLLLETGGRLVTGSTMIPTKPTITILESGGVTTMYWARSIGAARYFVTAPTDRVGFFGYFTGDTSHVIKRDATWSGVPATPYFTVVALDSNLVAYRADSTVRRAGIVGAAGVFGAMATDRVPNPPP
jgi:hypothetical protein